MALGTQRRIKACLIAKSKLGEAGGGASVPVILSDPARCCLPTSLEYVITRETSWLGGEDSWAAFSDGGGATIDMDVYAIQYPILTQYLGYPGRDGNVGGLGCREYADPEDITPPHVAIGWIDEQAATEDIDPQGSPQHSTSFVVKIALYGTGIVQGETSTSKPNVEKPDANNKSIHFTFESVYDASYGRKIYRRIWDGGTVNAGHPLTEVEARYILYTIFKVPIAVNVNAGGEQPHLFDLNFGSIYNIDDIVAQIQDPQGRNRQIAQIINRATQQVIERGSQIIPVVGPVVGPAIAQYLGQAAGVIVNNGLDIVWSEVQQQGGDNNNINNDNNNNNENNEEQG